MATLLFKLSTPKILVIFDSSSCHTPYSVHQQIPSFYPQNTSHIHSMSTTTCPKAPSCLTWTIHSSFLDGLLASNFAILDMTLRITARIIHLKNHVSGSCSMDENLPVAPHIIRMAKSKHSRCPACWGPSTPQASPPPLSCSHCPLQVRWHTNSQLNSPWPSCSPCLEHPPEKYPHGFLPTFSLISTQMSHNGSGLSWAPCIKKQPLFQT